MEYIAITLLAIAVTTGLVYLLANKVFHVPLRLKSLVLCAACALFLSLVLPRIVVSFAGLMGTVGFLAVFAVIFAYFVAYYDDPGDLQTASAAPVIPASATEPEPASLVAAITPANPPPPTETQPAPESLILAAATVTPAPAPEFICEPRPEPEAAPEPEPEVAPEPEPEVAPEPEPEAAPEPEPEAAPEPEPEAVPEPEPEAVPEPEQTHLDLSLIAIPADDPGHEDEEPSLGLTVLSPPAPRVEPEPLVAALESAPAPAGGDADTVQPEDEPDDLAPLADPLATFAFTDVAGQADEQSALADEPAADEPPAVEVDPPKEAIAMPVISEPASDSLDDLTDFAFAHKNAGNHLQALEGFRRALKLYRFSEAAPFLAIEIANLLKNRGSYDEAIALLSDSRGLPALLQNEDLDQQFVTTIAYLRIVKNTLLSNRLGYIPFASIPAPIVQEIDAEFREWRNLA